MRNARRISQILFFLLFITMFFAARYPYEFGIPADLFLRSSPLAGLSVIIASRTFISSVLIGFVILLLTIPLGRFFCGWICPLGTIIDFSDRFFKRPKKNIKSKTNTRFRFIKFFVLVAVLVGSLFSFQFVWFFDPIVLLTRTMTVVIFPIFVFFFYGLFNTAFNLGIAEDQLYTLYDFAQNSFLPVSQPFFKQGIIIFSVFLGILALGAISRRFWCRNLCPLGALFGIFSKFRLTQRYVNSSCTQCGLCQRNCRMNAIEDDYTQNNTVECIECAECVDVCPPKSISYRFAINKGKSKIDLSKRHFLQAGAAGITGLALVKTAAVSRNHIGQAIRPPGALEENQFLDRCIRCHECTKICSSTGSCLQPAVIEAGVEGFWTPVSKPRLGYCEYNCNLCGQVCPTGAIQKLDLEAKKNIKMGLAFFDKSRCIPWYKNEDCLVCEEHCPTPDKAIKFDNRQVVLPNGQTKVVKFPYVDETLCIGCGICENKCPVVGKPGVFVTASGQVRIDPDQENA